MSQHLLFNIYCSSFGLMASDMTASHLPPVIALNTGKCVKIVAWENISLSGIFVI